MDQNQEHADSSTPEFRLEGIKSHRKLMDEGLIGQVLVRDISDDTMYYLPVTVIESEWKYRLGLVDTKILESVLLRFNSGEEIICDYENKHFMMKQIPTRDHGKVLINDLIQFKEDALNADPVALRSFLQN